MFKKMSSILGYILISLLFLNQAVLGQQKWGRVSKEILQMTSFPQDTSAPAIVLFDIGKMIITENFDMELERHTRIKILTEEGKEYANIKIRYWHKDNINSIKAQTILPNGKKKKLDKKKIFEEGVKEYYKQKVFTMPAVEVGSVIEYKYTLKSEYLTVLAPWFFQHEIYTVFSRLSVTLQPGFTYSAFLENIFGEEMEPEIEESIVPGFVAATIKKYTWKQQDIPPIETEPYMLTLQDYQMALYFQLVQFRNAYVYVKYIKTWDDLSKRIYKNYNDFLSEGGVLKKKAFEIVGDSATSSEKIKLLYDFVRNEIETERHFSIYPRKSPKKVLKERSGNIAAKNILLINLLRNVGIDAHPVLISTRSNGRIITNWEQLQQFNSVLVYVKIGTKAYFLDTSDKYCPFTTLPKYDIVKNGLLVTKNKGSFLNIPEPGSNNKIKIITGGQLSEEGELICNSMFQYSGYPAISKRKKLNSEDEGDYIHDWLTDSFAEVEIDTFEIEELETIEKPLTISIKYRIPNYAQVVSDHIYLSPPLTNKVQKNPFLKEKRNFPIDYNYPFSTEEYIKISIPEGFTIEEQPKSENININDIQFSTKYFMDGNDLNIQRKFGIQKLTFYTGEYKKVRDIYSFVVSSDQGQIVLQRSSETVNDK